ncbi:hypothetical protein F5887DRAFT_1081159 [Amanita rubescens]|nr:hypothetical protein F5887DRAFT_1081159 [Amanita rubescens]
MFTVFGYDLGYELGVEYKPKNAPCAPSLTPYQLKKSGIRYIRVQWVDLTNNTRFRIVSLPYFEKLLQSRRPGLCLAKASLGLVDLELAKKLEIPGEYLCVPDLTSLRVCPYAPGEASVMGWLQDKNPVSKLGNNPSVEVDICPRSLLARVVKEARTAFSADFLVGFETEFILLKSTRPIEAINHHGWSGSNGFPSGKIETVAMREIADAIQDSGIELQMCHAEAAPGQYEVVTGPLSPLEAADALVHTREIIRNISVKHGLRATFAPRPFATSAGTGAHAHISIHSRNGERKTREGLTPYEKSFLAGVLEHLPALAALALPIPASFKRVADGAFAGGTYVCWGSEKGELPICLVNASSPTSRRFEMRFIDATANPYLALAGILTAGIDGLRKRQELTMKSCTGTKHMSAEEREAFGITRRLPSTYQEARSLFEESKLFRGAFGSSFVTKYLSVNKLLGEVLDQGSSEEEKLTHLVEFF